MTPGGTNKALGYLIGEKFLNYLRASDSSSDRREKIPLFADEIKRIFTVRIHARGRMFNDDVISAAADAILFERARALLRG